MNGIIIAINSGFLVKMVSNTIKNDSGNEKLTKALYVVVVFGVGETIGSISIGKLIDCTSNKFGVIMVLILQSIAAAVTVYTLYRNTYDGFWFLTAF